MDSGPSTPTEFLNVGKGTFNAFLSSNCDIKAISGAKVNFDAVLLKFGPYPVFERQNGDTNRRMIAGERRDATNAVDARKKTSVSGPVVVKDRPRMLLHKTASIFLRNLSPAITKQEVEAVRRDRFNACRYI